MVDLSPNPLILEVYFGYFLYDQHIPSVTSNDVLSVRQAHSKSYNNCKLGRLLLKILNNLLRILLLMYNFYYNMKTSNTYKRPPLKLKINCPIR